MTETMWAIDLGPIMVVDWLHSPYEFLVRQVLTSNGIQSPYRPYSDLNLVAGVGHFPCANITDGAPCYVQPYPEWEMEPGKTYRVRFIGSGVTGFQRISLDEHKMTVIANDFVHIEPYETDSISLAVGQRTDVLITANADAMQAYWFRAYNEPHCSDNNLADGRGIIRYEGADPNAVPTTQGITLAPNQYCSNDNLTMTVPVYPVPVEDADTTITFIGTRALNASGVFRYSLNNVSYSGNLDDPLLFDAVNGQTAFPPERAVYNTGTSRTVRLIVMNNVTAPHPVHLHGHEFQVLAQGFGEWDGHIVSPSNPQRRDTQNILGYHSPEDPRYGMNYLVLQYVQDNPGIWPFHCHTPWHLSEGMVAMLLERPDDRAKVQLPESVERTCDLFEEWQVNRTTPQLDSGVRKRAESAGDSSQPLLVR